MTNSWKRASPPTITISFSVPGVARPAIPGLCFPNTNSPAGKLMQHRRLVRLLIAVVSVVIVGNTVVFAQPPRAPLSLEPEGARGEAVFPALEGWYENDDGTFTILLGYFNRNEEPLDIPIGPDNRIEPGGPDMGQPSHFFPGREWGVFSITVPADSEDQEFTWTLTANNQQSVVTFWLNPAYYVDMFLNRANGNVPPTLRVVPGGDSLQGPSRGVQTSYTATVGQPLELWAHASDVPLTNPPQHPRRGRERPPLTLRWELYRGPADVEFAFESNDQDTRMPQVIGAIVLPNDQARHAFEDISGGETTSLATFAEPGDYRLIVTVNDISGNGGSGDQCCWTTAHVDVSVQE